MTTVFSLVQELWPFLVLLYAADGFVLLWAGHRLFRDRGPAGFAVSGGPGLRWLGWRPDRRAYTASRPLVLATPEGLWLPRRAGQEGSAAYDPASYTHLGYDDLGELVVEHHTLRLGPGRVLRLPSAGHARALAGRLRSLRDAADQDERRRLLAGRPAAELAAFREHEAELTRRRRPLVVLCWAQTVLLFGLLPWVAYRTSFAQGLEALLVLAGLGHLAVLGGTIAVARRIRRDGLGRPRGVLLPLFLSPPAALRAASALVRDLCDRFDDLTLAAALLPRREVLRLARRELHGAAYAAERGPDDWRWAWRDRRERLCRLLAELGASEAEALAPPPKDDPTAVRYCPLCEGEYRAGTDACDGCLMPLSPL